MPEIEGPEPPLPAYDLPAVFALRNRLINEAAYGYYEAEIDGPALTALTDEFHAILKTRDVAWGVVYESLRPTLLGRALTGPVLDGVAWRLAGNLARLREGVPVHTWARQRTSEWMPLEVLSVSPGRDRFDKVGDWVDLRVLAGSACPKRLTKFWSRPAAALFAGEIFGFNHPWSKPPLVFSTTAQLVRLWFYGLFTPKLSRDKPGFRAMRGTATLVKRNVQILRVRFRHDACPRGYAHPCHVCAHGYAGEESCRFATHPERWYADHCPACEQDDQAFDPALDSPVCVACTRKRRLAHRNKEET